MERRATVAAEFPSGRARAQPMAASRAFRINALHSPTWQILHAFPPHGLTRIVLRRGSACPDRFPRPPAKRKVAGILRRCSCGVKQKHTIPSGRVARQSNSVNTVHGAPPLDVDARDLQSKSHSPFTSLAAFLRICACHDKDKIIARDQANYFGRASDVPIGDGDKLVAGAKLRSSRDNESAGGNDTTKKLRNISGSRRQSHAPVLGYGERSTLRRRRRRAGPRLRFDFKPQETWARRNFPDEFDRR